MSRLFFRFLLFFFFPFLCSRPGGRQGLGVKCREVEKATVGSEGIELADGRVLHLNAQIPGWIMDGGGGVWFPSVRDLVPLSV